MWLPDFDWIDWNTFCIFWRVARWQVAEKSGLLNRLQTRATLCRAPPSVVNGPFPVPPNLSETRKLRSVPGSQPGLKPKARNGWNFLACTLAAGLYDYASSSLKKIKSRKASILIINNLINIYHHFSISIYICFIIAFLLMNKYNYII